MKSKKGKTPEQKDRRANTMTMKRILFLMGTFGVFTFGVLFWKLWNVQIINHEHFEEIAISNQTRDVSVSANRGTIYDAKGNILAISASVQNVIISPRDVIANKLDQNLIADGLSEILELDREKVMKRLEKTNSAWEQVATKIEDDLAETVRKFILDNKLTGGVYLTADTKRYYPYSSLAAQVIGFVNGENQGAYGLEAIYNGDLSGENGRVITAKNASGTEMLSGYEAYVDAQDGFNLNLTIDATIQYYAQRTLEQGMDRFQVQNGGFCIVMNPKNGAIYAMASLPDYDLNQPNAISNPSLAAELEMKKNNAAIAEEDYLAQLQEVQFAQWRNKALNDTYEPGSTFKPIVVASALEEGAVSEADTFFCSGSIKVADWVIRCHDHKGHGSQSLRKAVMNSCNPALIQIGEKLGAEKFYQYLEDFGFTTSTGVELQGESSSILWDKDKFTGTGGVVSLATASFGQRFQITPIQLITAISAVINGGHLLEPYVVQSVTDQDGNVVKYRDKKEVRQVISQETSDTVRSIMESVVGDGGTGKNAYVEGYRIGGKTGTSQTLDKNRFITSFIGFAPADDPEMVVLLAFDGPTPSSPGSNYTSGGYYISGGNMAAPMAGELIANILDYMGVQKQYNQAAAEVAVPNVIDKTRAEAEKKLKEAGLQCRAVGSGDTVTGQTPTPGAMIPGESAVVLYLGAEKPTEKVTVPNVLGRTQSAVQSMLEDCGLYMRTTGTEGAKSSNTVSFSQSIEAGAQVEAGTVVQVRFMDNSVQDYAD